MNKSWCLKVLYLHGGRGLHDYCLVLQHLEGNQEHLTYMYPEAKQAEHLTIEHLTFKSYLKMQSVIFY